MRSSLLHLPPPQHTAGSTSPPHPPSHTKENAGNHQEKPLTQPVKQPHQQRTKEQPTFARIGFKYFHHPALPACFIFSMLARASLGVHLCLPGPGAACLPSLSSATASASGACSCTGAGPTGVTSPVGGPPVPLDAPTELIKTSVLLWAYNWGIKGIPTPLRDPFERALYT